MSHELKIFKDKHGNELYITAFVGQDENGKGGDASIQFTTRNDYCCLTSKEVKELIRILKKRLNREDGFRATD